MIRVLIADDHVLVRETLGAFLESAGGFELTLVEDLEAACSSMEASRGYDLVLLDYQMPGMNGLEGLSRAMDVNRGKPVALMSGVANRKIAQDAMEAGAIGFLPKTMAANSLVNAVRFMAMGEQFVPVSFMNEPEETEIDHPLAEKLTPREIEVLGGLCRGLANKEIARELDLQEVTIKMNVKTLCRKLEAKNRTHAAMIAKDAGLF